MPRPLTKQRPKMGTHLAKLRTEAGFSQQELASLIDVQQQTIAFWEQSDKPPRSDVLLKLAEVLGVRVEEVLAPGTKPRRSGGPVGRVRQAFDQVATLPRGQQTKVVEIVTALVSQYQQNGG